MNYLTILHFIQLLPESVSHKILHLTVLTKFDFRTKGLEIEYVEIQDREDIKNSPTVRSMPAHMR